MKGFKRLLCLPLLASILGLLLNSSLTAGEARPEKTNWDNLQRLATGQEIRLVLNDAKSYLGTFQTVNADTIVLRLEAGEQTFARKDVLRVSAKRTSHRLRNALIGTAAGGEGGAAIGAATSGDDLLGGPIATGAGLVTGLVVGAAVGALLPTGGWQDVYRAR